MKKFLSYSILLIVWILSCALDLSAQANQLSSEQLERWLKRFPEADADGDGVLTAEEATLYRQAARSTPPDDAGQGALRSAPSMKFHPDWDSAAFPDSAVYKKTPDEIMSIYENGPQARSGPVQQTAMSYPQPTDGAMRIVGVGHSFMAPAYRTLPLICKAAGFEQPLCLHTGGGVTGSARYKWEQENGIFEFDGKPVPKLLAAISNAEWEAMLFGGYYNDRPEFYTCWIEFCTRFHPDMKFYLSDAWPQVYQLGELLGITELPESETIFTESLLDQMKQSKHESNIELVKTIRKETTEKVFILPTNYAVTKVAKLYLQGKLPGVEGLHKAIGGKDRSIWRDQTGHLGPGLDRLEGYIFYATLYGKSPELIEESIDFPDNPEYPNQELDRIFRRVAWEAVTGHPLSGVVDKNNNRIADHLE